MRRSSPKKHRQISSGVSVEELRQRSDSNFLAVGMQMLSSFVTFSSLFSSSLSARKITPRSNLAIVGLTLPIATKFCPRC